MPALTPSASTTTQKVLDTVGRVLAPLARLMIAKGVTFQMASEVMKRAYVQAAQKHFVEADDAASGTKLSLLTGLNRKEIRRLTSEEQVEKRAPMASYASAVNAAWRTQRRWKNKDGSPKALPKRGAGSFDELVRSVTTDHRPSAVFEELERLGYVGIDSTTDNIALLKNAYLFAEGFEEKLLRLTENIEDHLTATVVNITASEPTFLERSVFSDELSPASAAKLQQLSRAEWSRIQELFVIEATNMQEADTKRDEKLNTRIRAGMYFYSETTETEKI